jgi:hypothetical protein
MIYNPNQKNGPKTKPIFKVIRPGTPQSRGSSLSHSGGSDQNYLAEIGRQADQMSLFSQVGVPLNSSTLNNFNNDLSMAALEEGLLRPHPNHISPTLSFSRQPPFGTASDH